MDRPSSARTVCASPCHSREPLSTNAMNNPSVARRPVFLRKCQTRSIRSSMMIDLMLYSVAFLAVVIAIIVYWEG